MQRMKQPLKVAPEGKGWLSPLPLSPRCQEGKIGRGKGDASIAEAGLTGDIVKGRGWQESTRKTAESWDFCVRLLLGVAAALDVDGVRVVGPGVKAGGCGNG